MEQPGAAPAATPAPPPDQANAQMQSLQVLPGAPREFTDAQVVAKVGSEAILASDVKLFIQDIVDQKKIDVPPDQREQLFAGAARPVLKQMIDIKLVYNDCIHTIPKEALGKIQSSVNEEFDKSQLPKLLKDNDVSTRQELEAKLRDQGRSLDAMRRTFFERVMQGQWLQEKVKLNQEPTLSELLGYYEQHHSDYEFPSQARWEELMVRYDKFPDKASAWAAIAQMGIQVQQGAPLADVAKASSQGFTAEQGGVNDWTTKGSLTSTEIDEALFKLPVGSLSTIITSDRGFHIVRVVERKNAGRKPFEETQAEIKKQLKTQANDKQLKKYLDDLRQKTPVWTVYDTEPGGIDGPKEPPSGS
jgi:parvulin-like peptidyl-prolyl isomerase